VSQRHRPSLIGALLWTGLGVLFLLSNLGMIPDVLMLIQRYWPLLLILLGAGKVVDYFLRKDSVSIRFGECIGILFLLFAGIFFTKISESNMSRFLRQVPFKIGNLSVYPERWIGNSLTYTKEAVFSLDGSTTIRIENSHGKVSVAPGSDGEVRVRLKSEVYADESRASDLADTILIEGEYEASVLSLPNDGSLEVSKSPFVIKINDDALKNTKDRIDTDIEVFVPVKSNLHVENSVGDVRVAGINGKLDLSNTHQQLEVRDCEGEFDISSHYGECRLVNLTGNLNLESRSKVSMENLKGDVVVDTKFSPLVISNVDGKVTVSISDGDLKINNVSQPVVVDARGTQVTVARLQNSLAIVASHSRNINVEDVASNVSLESQYSTVFLKDVGGDADIQSDSDHIGVDTVNGNLTMQGSRSGIRVNGARSGLNIRTTRKDVVVNGFSGSCNIANEYADIRVSMQNLDRNEVNIKNRNGGIDLSLPEPADFSMNAIARQGKIESFYEGLDSPPGTGNVKVMDFNKDSAGARIRLETEYDNIRIFSNSRNNNNGR